MTKETHDDDDLPIWGAPDSKILEYIASKPKRKSAIKENTQYRNLAKAGRQCLSNEARRKRIEAENFELQAQKPIRWAENIRTASTGGKPFGYCSIECLYRAFVKRMKEEGLI